MYNSYTMKRAFFDLFLILSVFLAPWWFTVMLSVVGIFLFKNFIEFLVTNVAIQVLSTPSNDHITMKVFLVYSFIIIFYILAQYIRNQIILYQNEISYKP